MFRIQIDGTALALAVLAAAFGFSLLPGPFTWMASIAGLVLAIVLLSFDGEGRRSLFESLGFSAAVGLCLTLASAVLFRLAMTQQGQPGTFDGRLANEYLPLVWVALTVFLWVVDRSRMSGRLPQTLPPGVPAVPHTSSFSFVPRDISAAPVPAPSQAPVPAAVASAPTPGPEPSAVTPAATPVHATFTQPSFGASAAPAEGHAPPVAPSVTPIQRTPPQVFEHPAAQPPAFAPEPTPAPAPQPVAVAVPSGKEATVYVTLVGEGLNVLRAVRAEHLGRDFYKIVEDMPAGETWQFGPGQVVRCKKRNLSSGKAMVAIEEAPRAS